jgi:hypothetical protein
VREERPEENEDEWPPGEFLDEDQQEDTKRFVEAARRLARRRAEERPWEELE